MVLRHGSPETQSQPPNAELPSPAMFTTTDSWSEERMARHPDPGPRYPVGISVHGRPTLSIGFSGDWVGGASSPRAHP